MTDESTGIGANAKISIGRYRYSPILVSIGRYRYRSNPMLDVYQVYHSVCRGVVLIMHLKVNGQ